MMTMKPFTLFDLLLVQNVCRLIPRKDAEKRDISVKSYIAILTEKTLARIRVAT